MASGGPGVTIEARWGHQAELARAGVSRVGLVDPGSVTLGSLWRSIWAAMSALAWRTTPEPERPPTASLSESSLS